MYNPDFYEANNQLQIRDARELIPYLVKNMDWSRTKTIMDFGCGSGYVTNNILLPLANEKTENNNLKLTGVDISKKMIEFASIYYKNEQINWKVFDVMKKKPNALKFDKIFSGHVLHWIHDQKAALENLFDLLNENGEIGIYLTLNAPLFPTYQKMSTNPKWIQYLKDVDKFIPLTYKCSNPTEYMKKMLSNIGFTVQECIELHRSFIFQSPTEMIDLIFAANPFGHRIPIELQDEYKFDLEDTLRPYLVYIPEINGKIRVQIKYSLLMIRAYKA